MKHERVRLLYALGRPLAPLYGMIMTLRAALYRQDVFRKKRLDVPVISVGNLTLGGSGKTPMTIYLAELLREMDPVVVSRGYGGSASAEVNVVSDRKNLLLDVREAGDESFLMAKALPGIPVVTGRKKRLAAEYAAGEFKPGVVIVDDGFQHLALDRDLNMVLFKVDTFLGNNRIFPGGDMREPLKALGRADCFVLNCVDDDNRPKAEAIEKALRRRFPEIPVFAASYRPTGLIDQENNKWDIGEIKGKKYFGFCGLAEPASFQEILARIGVELTGFNIYPDHHAYSAKDLRKIAEAAELSGAEGLITTEKDMVKVRDGKTALKLNVLSVPMELVPFEGFSDFVEERIAR